MLDYIKQQLQEMNPAPQQEAVQEQLMDQAILDCAHLFQEFDDLSLEGTATNGPRQFANVDIPLEDNPEITSVELNLLDGRVVDVPMDATVQESVDLGLMKTFDDFYQEACDTLVPFGRETQGVFESRCKTYAEAEYQKYRDYLIQEGLFGFDKIPIDDKRVPSSVTMDFGSYKGNDHHYVKLSVAYQVDKKNRITHKQLEAIQIFMSDQSRTIACQEVAFDAWGGMCGCKSVEEIWDKVTPTALIVPVDPIDRYCIAIEFEIDGVDDKKFLSWEMVIRKGKKGDGKLTNASDNQFKQINPGKVESLKAITPKKARQIIKEQMAMEAAQAEPVVRNRFSRNRFGYIQEAIDFGDPNAAPAPESAGGSVSFGDENAQPDANAAAPEAENAAPPAEGEAAPKEIADPNNVSDEIAEKVSDETKNAAVEDEGLNVDGIDDGSNDADSAIDSTDMPTEDDVNADIGDVDANSEDTAGDEAAATSDVDVDNMTIEELLAQGQEKLKKMTVQQLKDFMNSPDGNAPELPAGDEGVQEAFFLTRGNIGKELDIHLRKTLGILNDSDMEIEMLCAEFRKEGKQLNRVVHKASKMKDVFNEEETKQLLKLNALLSDLMAVMRTDQDKSGVDATKRLIRAFVQQATGVAKLVEQNHPGKPVQEAAAPKSLDFTTVENKLGRKLPESYKKFVNEESRLKTFNVKHDQSGRHGSFEFYTPRQVESSINDQFDYDGKGGKFIAIANDGWGNELLMGNTSKTDERIFVNIHDNPADKRLVLISKTWADFRKKLSSDDSVQESALVQEAATSAALLNVQNQLRNMLSDAFDFIGGSMIPTFTMKSKEKPELAIKVSAQGTNVEATPVVNGAPDLIHKKKGIAIMRAAQTIADFAKDLVSKFKSN